MVKNLTVKINTSGNEHDNYTFRTQMFSSNVRRSGSCHSGEETQKHVKEKVKSALLNQTCRRPTAETEIVVILPKAKLIVRQSSFDLKSGNQCRVGNQRFLR